MPCRIGLTLKLLPILLAATIATASAQTPLSPDAEHMLEPGDHFFECYGCPTMVAVPAGTFLMGSLDNEPGHVSNESPRHRVTIARPFAVGRVTVTADEWNACARDHACDNYRSGGSDPVSLVSWEDAHAYLAWLSRKTGKTYRLLTEAEFEYAARAGSDTAYPWGDAVGTNNANCKGCGSPFDNKLIVKEGQFAPNAFGLNDMVGNIFQWVEDCYHDTYDGAPTDGSAWVSSNCSARIVRGGAYYTVPASTRSAIRIKFASARSSAVSFRAARTLSPDAVVARIPIPAASVVPRPLRPKAGERFRECAHCPEMVVIAPGSFMMGAPANENGYRDAEAPEHKVTIAKPFAVGRFAVTFDEWDACVADKGCNFIRPEDEGWGRGRRPVINVTWNEAKLYVDWLRRKAGKAYRLLSKAEWEFVARAGTTTPYWTGNSIAKTQANFGDYKHGRTAPVDSFAPNPWGLYQLAGNTYEWVEDCDHVNYKGAPADGSTYVVRDFFGDCKKRVYRGGSWGSAEQALRSAYRDWTYPDIRMNTRGFRVATGL